MRNNLSKLIFFLSMSLVIAGCSTIKEYRGYVPDRNLVNSVREEIDTKDSVEAMLGNPTMKSTFDDSNWYYYSKNTERWGFFKEKVTRMNILAITFDEESYVSDIRRYSVEDNKIIDPVSKKTITHGKDINFLAELFGNVGRFGAAGAGIPEAGN